MSQPFVVISGLPGSGKTTLGRRLAPALGLPLIDKDDILDSLFEAKGVGDAAWRRALSRESDEILQHQATSSSGAVLVSFWRVPGMAGDSGTPSDWLAASSHQIVHLHCVCDPDVAASRFVERRRHRGHRDAGIPHEEVLAGIRALARLPPLDLGQRIDVDTSRIPDLDEPVRAIRNAFECRVYR